MATYGYPVPFDEDDPPLGPVQPRPLIPGFRVPPLPGMGMTPPQQQQGGGMGDISGLLKMVGGMGGMGGSAGAESAEGALMNTGGGGGLLGGIMGGGGGGGFGGSPWDIGFSMLGRAHGAAEGNDPNRPLVHHNRQPTDREWMVQAGAPIGGAIGSIWGMPGTGMLAGQNFGATVADLTSGNIHNLGYDLSSNLPPLPGFQAEGWKGIANAATGLPLGTLFGKLFG